MSQINWKLKKEFHKLSAKQRLYQVQVPIIGLTGGIGTGKSTYARKLKELGAPLVCADDLVKQVYQLQETKKFLTQLSSSFVNKDKVDFEKIREQFYKNPKLKQQIESFIYGQLPSIFMHQVQALGKIDLLIYDVPLLFEKKLEALFDLIILVYAPVDVQIDRVVERDSHKKSYVKEVISHQMDIETKKTLADITLDNSQDTDLDHKNWHELDQFINQYLERS
jgi:dephospho-CoA kinase